MVSIFILADTTEQIGIVEEDNSVIELAIDRPGTTSQVGNIYKAKVVKIDKGLQAAFIDFGQERLGFLDRKQLPVARKNPDKPIESLLTEGQSLIIQVDKDAYGTKGARLTANITVAGVGIVYLPYGNYVAASKRLSEEKRNLWKETITSILDDEEGAIIRTSVNNSSIETIIQEFNYLREKWMEIDNIGKKSRVPSCIYSDKLVPDRLVRKYPPQRINAIYVDKSSEANRLRRAFPYIDDLVQWDKKVENRLSAPVKQLMTQTVTPTVKTNSGVELMFEQTEALTVIDIDTGGFRSKQNKKQTVLQANRIAAIEIARQLRLRNISGIIIIDFITMNHEADRTTVIKTLKAELNKDPIRTEVFGFTKLGLLEMTRKRESVAIAELLLDNTNKKVAFSTVTHVFMLERELMEHNNNQNEAIYFEINPTVFRKFKETIELTHLKANLTSTVYVKETKGQATYQIKLAGSEQVVTDYFAHKANDSIDKLF